MIKLKVGLYKYKRVAGIILLLFSITYAFGQNNAPETNQDNNINSETNSLYIKDQASDSLNITKPLLIPANKADSAFQITNISDSTSEYSMPTDSAILNTIPPDSLSKKTDLLDSAALNPDLLDSATLSADLLDSAALAADSIPPAGDIETTIKYSARDSMNLSLTNQNVDLYGDGKIVYGDIELSADRVNVDYEIHEIQAEGTEDSLGNPVGEPIFKDGPDVYETEKMRYNFKSEKAIIKGVVTQQGEGIMHGNTVKRDQRGDLYIDRAKYTTCNRPDPHFHIEARKLKLVPNDKIMVGPFHMRVNDIPLPIGWGFGMFPMPRTQSSGVIVPTFGEEKRRGFFLKDGGYYFAMSDYVDLALTGEIFSKGSYGLGVASTYRKRYAFNGQFSFKYNRQKGIDEGDSSVIKDFWVTWSHSPQSKGSSRFSAQLRAGTSSYNQNNPSYYDVINNINQEFSSSVSYSKTLTGTPFNFGLSGRLQQNTGTGKVNLQLPDYSLTMNRIYPFKGKSPTAKNIIQKINFSWNMVGTNNMSNQRVSLPFNFDIENKNPNYDSTIEFNSSNLGQVWERSRNGIQHRIPISTSAKVLKHFTINPAANYNEIWYFKELNYTWNDSLNAVRIDTTKKFSRLYSYNFSAGLNTRMYGTMYFKGDKVQAIRHVITPNISFSYAPDFSSDKFGYYQTVQVDSLGNTQEISKYTGFAYGTPSRGENASMGISISNTLEMKVRDKKDSANEFKKVPIFENFSLSTSYNFLADSFNLAPLRITARTKLFNKKLDININGTLDPYVWILDSIYYDGSGNERVVQRKTGRYAWDEGMGLGQFTQANLSIGTSFNPESWENKASDVDKEQLTDAERNEMEYIEQNPDLYVDFNIPWNFRVNYNVNYRKRGYEKASITQTLRFSGDFSLTPKWKIGFSSGYDFENKGFTQTNVNISRDLHCWQLAMTWIPFGRYQSYNVTIRAKSSLLQDLKLNRQRSWWDN